MAIYYVDTNAAAGGNGTTSATTGANCAWDTIADVNAASFLAGDSILFNKGCTWNEQFLPPSSGSAGSPITFSSYGTGDKPIINLRKSITAWNTAETWTDTGGNIWTMAWTPIAPSRIWLSGVEKPKAASATVTALRPWWWAANVLYIYSTSNPASAFSNVEANTIVAGAPRFTIYVNTKNYLTFDGLDVRGGGQAILVNAVNNIIIKNCNIGMYSQEGIETYSQTGQSATTAISVYDNIIESGYVNTAYAASIGTGIRLCNSTTNSSFYRNTVSNWGGYLLTLDSSVGSAMEVTGNNIYQNTFSSPNTFATGGMIVEGTAADVCENNNIYQNIITDTQKESWFQGKNNKLYYNIFKNGTGGAVRIEGYDTLLADTNTVANNVFYNFAASAIHIHSLVPGLDKFDNIIANNIILNCDPSGVGITIDSGADVLDNVYTNNVVYTQGLTDTLTTWTASPWQTVRTNTFAADLATSQYNFATVIPANLGTFSGNKVRVTLAGIGAGGSTYNNSSISLSTVAPTSDADPTPLLWGGNASVTVAAGSTTTSDALTFSFDCTKQYLIKTYQSTRQIPRTGDATKLTTYYDATNADETGSTSLPNSGNQAQNYGLAKLEVLVENVYYKTSITTDYTSMTFDGAAGTSKASVVLLTTDKDFFMDSANDILYIYSTTDPAGRTIIATTVPQKVISYRGTSYTVTAWEAAVSDGDTISGNLQSDPLFVNAVGADFRLKVTSPCKDAGTSVGLTTDYVGNPVGATPDIGAYEYLGGSKLGADQSKAKRMAKMKRYW